MLKVIHDALAELAGRRTGTTPKTTLKTTLKTGRNPTPSVGDQIVDLLRDHPKASRRTIADHLGNISADGVKYHLNQLKIAGRIRHQGSTRGGQWVVLG